MAEEKKEEKPELKEINKNMSFGEILSMVPEAGMIMANYGLHCIGCMFAYEETVEEGCTAHGFDKETVDKMVKEINDFIKKKKEEK